MIRSFAHRPESDAHGIHRSSHGFTMIELIVAISVIAILAGIAVPVVTRQFDKSKINSTRKEMSDLAKSVRAYGSDVGFDPTNVTWGRFPPEETGSGRYRTILGSDLETNGTGTTWNPLLRKGWNGPYISSGRAVADPTGSGAEIEVAAYRVDGWGRYYVYTNRNAAGRKVRKNDTERVITLVSGGPDLNPRTAADNLSIEIYRGDIH